MDIAIRSDKGLMRETNQDALYASRSTVGALPNLFIVADGMGGAKAGEVASSSAIYSFLQAIRAEEEQSVELFEGQDPLRAADAGALFENAIEKANKEVWEMSVSDSQYEGMGTTIAVCSIIDGILEAVNVGDSRIYMLGEDSIEQLTEDHTVTAELLRRGKITPDEAEFHHGKHMLTRAIGTEEVVKTQHYEKSIKGTELVILCSDGLYENVDEKDIFRIKEANASNLEAMADALLNLSLDRGGRDNISFIIIDLKKEAENA